MYFVTMHLLGWKLSQVALHSVSQRQNATGLSFQPNIYHYN